MSWYSQTSRSPGQDYRDHAPGLQAAAKDETHDLTCTPNKSAAQDWMLWMKLSGLADAAFNPWDGLSYCISSLLAGTWRSLAWPGHHHIEMPVLTGVKDKLARPIARSGSSQAAERGRRLDRRSVSRVCVSSAARLESAPSTHTADYHDSEWRRWCSRAALPGVAEHRRLKNSLPLGGQQLCGGRRACGGVFALAAKSARCPFKDSRQEASHGVLHFT